MELEKVAPAENPFLPGEVEQPQENSAMAVVSSGEVARVQGQIISAKRFPRDQFRAYERIMQACRRPKLAKEAIYAYPRGGTTVKGPSIRLAEELARNWGNIDMGVRELSNANGESIIEAYAMDLETNSRDAKTFTVKHERKTKSATKILDDPRDIYEAVANQGSRRKRACILAIIPGDIVDDALQVCEKTLSEDPDAPLEDRVKKMVVAFGRLAETVSKSMLEDRLGHEIVLTSLDEISELEAVFRSMKDGMTKRTDWFQVGTASPASGAAARLNNQFDAEKQPPKQRKPRAKKPLIEVETKGGEQSSNLKGFDLVIAQIEARKGSSEDLRDFYFQNEPEWKHIYSPDQMAEIDETYQGILDEFVNQGIMDDIESEKLNHATDPS